MPIRCCDARHDVLPQSQFNAVNNRNASGKILAPAGAGLSDWKRMSNQNDTAEIIPSGFLASGTANCPPELVALAISSAPLPFVFVRAIGTPTLLTARDAAATGLAAPILVGEPAQIRADASEIGWDLRDVEIVPADGEEDAIRVAIELFSIGRAAGLVKGQLHTDIFMGGIVRRESGIRTDKRMVHLFAMLSPSGGRPLFISDAAVNVAPDITTRVEAALNMAELARRLGRRRPKIAILSATELVLPAMPSSADAAEIAERAAKLDPAADYIGPLSFDLAVSPQAAAIKGISNPVAGMADALVVPNIEAGNILFKSLVWCSGGLAAGLVLGGAVPIVLTSRSDPPAARLASLALAAIAGRQF
jgi:phosphate acetyltransferase